jgi:hypothetical protein
MREAAVHDSIAAFRYASPQRKDRNAGSTMGGRVIIARDQPFART